MSHVQGWAEQQKALAALTTLDERKRGKKRLWDMISARQAAKAIMLR